VFKCGVCFVFSPKRPASGRKEARGEREEKEGMAHRSASFLDPAARQSLAEEEKEEEKLPCFRLHFSLFDVTRCRNSLREERGEKRRGERKKPRRVSLVPTSGGKLHRRGRSSGQRGKGKKGGRKKK